MTAFARMNAACIRAFGQAVTFTPAVGSSYSLQGILDSGEATEALAPAAAYVLWAPLTSFAAEPVKGDEVSIGSNTFIVADVHKEPNDAGGRKLLLRYKRS